MGLPFSLIVNFIKKCSLRRIFKTWQRSRSPFIYESFLEGFWQFGSGLNAWTRARFCLHLHLGLVSLWPHYVLWALKFPMLMWNVLLHQSGNSVWKNRLWGGGQTSSIVKFSLLKTDVSLACLPCIWRSLQCWLKGQTGQAPRA